MADTPETGVDHSTLNDQNRDVVYDRDVDKVIEDQEASETLDANERPGLLEGQPFIPPVAAMGPGIGGAAGGMGGASGTVAGGLPLPVVPVIDRDSPDNVDTGVLVNPFTPADPDNERPFEADIPSPVDLAARVETELASDGRLSMPGLSVVNEDGVIHLDGVVPSSEVARDVEQTVARMPGVRGVVNHLRQG